MFNGSTKMVIGNKMGDNKDPKNRQTAQSSSMVGTFGKMSGQKLNTQNDKNATPPGPDQSGDVGVQQDAKNQKKIVRKDMLYSDKAIAIAKSSKRG